MSDECITLFFCRDLFGRFLLRPERQVDTVPEDVELVVAGLHPVENPIQKEQYYHHDKNLVAAPDPIFIIHNNFPHTIYHSFTQIREHTSTI